MSSDRDPSEWHLYESTSQLRDECRNGELASHIHPEFQSKSFPVSKNELELTCAALGVHVDAEYEDLADRGVELQKDLCTAGNGRMPNARPSDSRLAADWEEMGRISQRFLETMERAAVPDPHAPDSRLKSMRMMIDSYTLAGTCGHSMG